MLELNSNDGRKYVINVFFIRAIWRDENPRKKTPTLCDALVRILLIWWLKVKCESTSIPRSVTEDELVSWDPLMKYGWGIIGFDWDLWWIDKTVHLLILMLSCQELAQKERRSRDCWRSPQLETSTLKDEYSLTSSAKSLSLVWPTQVDETSFIKIKNKTGPKTEPCGTPLKTLVTLEKTVI